MKALENEAVFIDKKKMLASLAATTSHSSASIHSGFPFSLSLSGCSAFSHSRSCRLLDGSALGEERAHARKCCLHSFQRRDSAVEISIRANSNQETKREREELAEIFQKIEMVLFSPGSIHFNQILLLLILVLLT